MFCWWCFFVLFICLFEMRLEKYIHSPPALKMLEKVWRIKRQAPDGHSALCVATEIHFLGEKNKIKFKKINTVYLIKDRILLPRCGRVSAPNLFYRHT